MIPELQKENIDKKRLEYWSSWLESRTSSGDYKVNNELPRWLIALLPNNERRPKVLNYGSGLVSSIGFLSKHKDVGFSLYDHQRNELESLLRGSSFPPQGTFLELPSLDESSSEEFDLIYSCDYLEFSTDPLFHFRRMLNHLKPGGKMVTFHKCISRKEWWQMKGDQPWLFEFINGRMWVNSWCRYRDVLDCLVDVVDFSVSEENGYYKLVLTKKNALDDAIEGTFTEIERRRAYPISLLEKSLVSLHVPKTAGTSLRGYLERLYGDKIEFLYEESHSMVAQAEAFELSPLTRAVHGHFRVDVFSRKFETPIHMVWLRDPVQRAISSYGEIDRHFDSANNDRLVSRWKEMKYGLIDFVSDIEYRTQCSWYLHDFPLEKFDFIGITEQFGESMELFNKTFGLDFPLITDKIRGNPFKKGDRYELDEENEQKIREYLADECALYERAKQIFRSRWNRLMR